MELQIINMFRNNSGILSSYIVSILKWIRYRSNNSEQGFVFVLEKIEWNGDLYFHFLLHHLRLASFSTYWRHCTSYLTFNFITQCHISQITVCCLSNGVNLGKTTAVKCSGTLRVALDVRSEYFWFPQRFMSMCCFFICVFFPLSHCTWLRGPERFYHANETFSYFSLISLHSPSFSSGIYLWVNCRVSGTLQGFLPLSSRYFSL